VLKIIEQYKGFYEILQKGISFYMQIPA